MVGTARQCEYAKPSHSLWSTEGVPLCESQLRHSQHRPSAQLHTHQHSCCCAFSPFHLFRIVCLSTVVKGEETVASFPPFGSAGCSYVRVSELGARRMEQLQLQLQLQFQFQFQLQSQSQLQLQLLQEISPPKVHDLLDHNNKNGDCFRYLAVCTGVDRLAHWWTDPIR